MLYEDIHMMPTKIFNVYVNDISKCDAWRHEVKWRGANAVPKLHLNAKNKLVIHIHHKGKGPKRNGQCIILVGEWRKKFKKLSQSTQLTGCQKVKRLR